MRTNRTLSSGAATNLGVCLLAGCALIAAATWAAGDSTPRRLARGTHVGVPPSDTVMLQSQGQGSSLKFYRANPDGTVATTEYAVPTGMRLMVTDMEFATNSNGTSIGIMARVFIENRTTTTTRTLVAMIGGGGPAGQGGTASPVTGFSVSAGGRIVADALATSQAGYPTTFYTYPQNGTQGYHTILLRGYVVAEE